MAKRKIYINKKSTRTQQKTIEKYSDEVCINPSMRDLSKKHKITLSAIGDYAKKDEWVAKRKIYQNKKRTKTEQKTIENCSDEDSNKLLQFNQVDIWGLLGYIRVGDLQGYNVKALIYSQKLVAS